MSQRCQNEEFFNHPITIKHNHKEHKKFIGLSSVLVFTSDVFRQWEDTAYTEA